MDQSTTVLLFLAAVFIFGGIVFAAISFSKKSHKGIDVEKYRCRWLEIESSVKKDEPQAWSLAVLHADSLLGQALKDKNIPGKTMGEQMKYLQKTWSDANAVWGAHKIRNQIAHEPGAVQLDYSKTRQALGALKQGLKDIGAI